MAFTAAGLEPEPYLVTDDSFLRPSDLVYSSMDPSLIGDELDWRAKVSTYKIVQNMYEGKLF